MTLIAGNLFWKSEWIDGLTGRVKNEKREKHPTKGSLYDYPSFSCFLCTIFVVHHEGHEEHEERQKTNLLDYLYFSFVSFVLFVVENAFVVHLPFLVAATPRRVLRVLVIVVLENGRGLR